MTGFTQSVWFAPVVTILGVVLAGYFLIKGEALLRAYGHQLGPTSREQMLRQRLDEVQRELNAALAKVHELETMVDWLLAKLRAADPGAAIVMPAVDGRGAAAAPGGQAPSGEGEPDERRMVAVAVGSDPDLAVDLAVFRKIQRQTGLAFTRLTNVDKRKLESLLNRHRMSGHPVQYLHFAVHSSVQGLEFVDGIVPGAWLSEKLTGVEVVMLDACESDAVGDLLRNVPFVVTLLEEVPHSDAMLFAEAFWTEIGRGQSPTDAYYDALQRCPPDVGEYAQLHTWG